MAERIDRTRLGGAGVLLVGLLAACGGDRGGGDSDPADGGPNAAGSVSGTIALPEDVTEVCAMVALDTDVTGANGTAEREDGSPIVLLTLVSGASLDFTLSDVPPGAYFLWGYVDTDASVSQPPGDCEIAGGPASGDFLGWYDAGLAEPAAANVEIPHAAEAAFDFPLGVFP